MIVPGACVTHVNARTPQPDGRRVDVGRVAPDDAPRLELLHPLVRGRPGHAEVGPEVGVGAPAIHLQDPQQAGVGLTDRVVLGH